MPRTAPWSLILFGMTLIATSFRYETWTSKMPKPKNRPGAFAYTSHSNDVYRRLSADTVSILFGVGCAVCPPHSARSTSVRDQRPALDDHLRRGRSILPCGHPLGPASRRRIEREFGLFLADWTGRCGIRAHARVVGLRDRNTLVRCQCSPADCLDSPDARRHARHIARSLAHGGNRHAKCYEFCANVRSRPRRPISASGLNNRAAACGSGTPHRTSESRNAVPSSKAPPTVVTP